MKVNFRGLSIALNELFRAGYGGARFGFAKAASMWSSFHKPEPRTLSRGQCRPSQYDDGGSGEVSTKPLSSAIALRAMDARADPAVGTALVAFEQEEDPALGPRPAGVGVKQPPPHAPLAPAPATAEPCVRLTPPGSANTPIITSAPATAAECRSPFGRTGARDGRSQVLPPDRNRR